MKITALAIVLLTLALALAFGQGNISGVWKADLVNEDGTSRPLFFHLIQSGNAVSGEVVRDYRHIPITGGQVDGDHARFTIVIWNKREVTYDATLEGDRLRVTLPMRQPGMPQQVSAERSTEDAMKPPARLPLPALHDVPDNGLARTPPMGWNSWNHFAGRVTDQIIRMVADSMATNGMRDAGYVYVNIDDTWQGVRDSNGKLQSNKKFPDMKALADYVHNKGLKLGIYSSPGPSTCGSYAGSYGHEVDDAQTFAAWGIDYLKYDWCSAAAIYQDSDMQAAYQKMGEALQASGRPIVYSLCQYGKAEVWKWGAKVGGNAWRTTGDIGDNWKSLEDIGFRQIYIAPFAKPGHWNDPDMLEIGNGGMNQDEYRTHMTMWSMLAAPLLAGNDVRTMDEATRSILLNKDVIAIDQDASAQPAKQVRSDGGKEVWSRRLTDGSVAVALFNRTDDSQSLPVQWSELGLAAPIKARDLWTGQSVQSAEPGWTATVPRHGVVLLRVSGA